MMRGSAVPTIVWSIAARRAASSNPVSVPTSCGRVRGTMPEVWYFRSVAAVAIAGTPFSDRLILLAPRAGAQKAAQRLEVRLVQRIDRNRPGRLAFALWRFEQHRQTLEAAVVDDAAEGVETQATLAGVVVAI